jgi:transcription antitermination factor NusG
MLFDSKSILWYVLFATHGKAAKIGDYLKTVNIEYFFPVEHKEKRIKNSQLTKYVLQPLIGNLLFVKSSKECLDAHLQEVKLRFGIESSLYYRDLGSKEIIVVPETQMQNFISVAGCTKGNITYFSNEELNLTKGTKVRIIGGIFTGVEGIFMRIKGSSCVVVSLPKLLSVATAFIPTRFILPLE